METLSSPSAQSSLYGQITEEFRERILSGEWKPGERLPSFTEMRQQHRVSQATLNRVHGLLEAEGLILRRRGAGTFVCDPSERIRQNSDQNGARVSQTSFLSNAIVILTPFGRPNAARSSGGWLEWIALGANEAVQNVGMHAVALHPKITDEEIERLVSERPFGVLVPANVSQSSTPIVLLKKLRACGIATVVFGSSGELSDCDRVWSDHQSGAYQLTRLLLERGRRRIVNVQPVGLNEAWLDERHLGYERAMHEAGLEAQAPLQIPSIELSVYSQSTSRAQHEISEYDRAAFAAKVRALAGYFVEAMNGENAIDGILATTDRDTFTLAAICRLFGRDPQRDVSIAGYDNYFDECEERAFAPFAPIATVDKNNRMLGAAMVQLLLDRVNGRLDDAPQTRVVEPQIVVPTV